MPLLLDTGCDDTESCFTPWAKLSCCCAGVFDFADLVAFVQLVLIPLWVLTLRTFRFLGVDHNIVRARICEIERLSIRVRGFVR